MGETEATIPKLEDAIKDIGTLCDKVNGHVDALISYRDAIDKIVAEINKLHRLDDELVSFADTIIDWNARPWWKRVFRTPDWRTL